MLRNWTWCLKSDLKITLQSDEVQDSAVDSDIDFIFQPVLFVQVIPMLFVALKYSDCKDT